jgi:hypothetical protein
MRISRARPAALWAICDETPSPTSFGRKNRGSKTSGKKRQKAATNLSQFVAFGNENLPHFAAI